jgi:hypothetical protein
MALRPGISLVILLTITPRQDAAVVLENEYLRVEFFARDGAFMRLLNSTSRRSLS